MAQKQILGDQIDQTTLSPNTILPTQTGLAGQVLDTNGSAVAWHALYTTSASPPGSPNVGDVWTDSNTGNEYTYFIDANGNHWVQFSGASIPTALTVGTLATTANATVAGTLGVTGVATLSNNIVIPKTTNIGIQVDTATPTFGWRDINAVIVAKGSGVNNPAFSAYAGTSIFAYAFISGSLKEVWVNFHIPHDYVPGTDIFIHAHWSQTTADAGKSVVWFADALYAKSFAQQAFQSSVTTVSATQACSSTVREHMLAEVQLSSSAAIGGNGLEIDGIIMARMYRNAGVGSDTSTQDAYLHFCDIHYQSTNMATKQKAPNFYV